jgi:hypothetical protein
MSSSIRRRGPGPGSPPPPDPWGVALGEFLVNLLDGVEITFDYSPPDSSRSLEPIIADHQSEGSWSTLHEGPLGWKTRLSLRLAPRAVGFYPGETAELPPELIELPDASVRAIERVTAQPISEAGPYPSMVAALHDVVVAEMMAEQLAENASRRFDRARAARNLSDVLTYIDELSSTRIEGRSPTHGVVITAEKPEWKPVGVQYPGEIRTLKRTPLLFDGVASTIVLSTEGTVLGEMTRRRLSRYEKTPDALAPFEDALGPDGALVAATSRALGGIGLFLRSDQTVWVFDNGAPVLIRRGGRWKSLPLESLIAGVADLTGSADVAELVVRTALLASLRDHGAIIGVVGSGDLLEKVVEDKDRYDLVQTNHGKQPVESQVHRILRGDVLDVDTLLRITRIDGATIVDKRGRLIAYGAIVRSMASRSEGARTAAARTLSRVADVVLKVSEDGPISVFASGSEVASFL